MLRSADKRPAGADEIPAGRRDRTDAAGPERSGLGEHTDAATQCGNAATVEADVEAGGVDQSA